MQNQRTRTPPQAGSEDEDRELRRAISEALRRSPKSRVQIADELSARLGRRITRHMIDDFTSECKKQARFPLAFSAALCEILDDDSIAVLALRPRARKLLELAKRELAASADERDRQRLRDELLKDSKPGAE
jgi:hypothetical protein